MVAESEMSAGMMLAMHPYSQEVSTVSTVVANVTQTPPTIFH